MVNSDVNRRCFIGTAAAGGALGLAGAASAADHHQTAPIIKPGATVLFQGDSITDTGRDRGITAANDAAAMGNGYAFLAAADMLIRQSDDGLKFFNRGVSGNKVFQLADRWQADCLDLRPDVVSILIGVNDIWHKLNGKYDGTIEKYRSDYRELAARTKEQLPGVKLVICEPFVLKVGAVNDGWFPEFDGLRAAAREVAGEFGDVWVPMQSVLDAAAEFAPAKTWLRDGVHPTSAGAAVLAGAWLRAVGA